MTAANFVKDVNASGTLSVADKGDQRESNQSAARSLSAFGRTSCASTQELAAGAECDRTYKVLSHSRMAVVGFNDERKTPGTATPARFSLLLHPTPVESERGPILWPGSACATRCGVYGCASSGKKNARARGATASKTATPRRTCWRFGLYVAEVGYASHRLSGIGDRHHTKATEVTPATRPSTHARCESHPPLRRRLSRQCEPHAPSTAMKVARCRKAWRARTRAGPEKARPSYFSAE